MALSIPTFADIYALGKAAIQAINPSLTDFGRGSVLDALTGGTGVLADQVLRYAAHRFNALFLDQASGADLDALVLDRYGLTRLQPTPSQAHVTVTLGSTDVTLATDAVFTATTTTGVVATFSPQTLTTVLAPTLGSKVSFIVVCTDTGSDTNIPLAGTTWELTTVGSSTGIGGLTYQSGVPSGLLHGTAIGGSDIETDAALRVRAKLYYQTLVRGTMAALRAGALSVEGIRYASVIESGVSMWTPFDSLGWYPPTVYVADASGTATDDEKAAVRAELDLWRAAGIQLGVAGGDIDDTNLLTVTYIAVAGANTSGLESAMRNAIIAYGTTLSPGQTVYLDELGHICHELSEDLLSVLVTLTATPSATSIDPSNETAIRFKVANIAMVNA